MKLHEDKNAFRVLLEHIHMRTGYRTDVLEKDYYVVRLLELAVKAFPPESLEDIERPD